MRFLHVADVHLDASFAGRSEEVRRRLREASREAFRRAVELAIREDVHVFLIAGDLFDGERLSFETERFLLEQAGRLGDHGIVVVYVTGNHDPGSDEVGPRPLAWPPNVRVISDATPQRLRILDATGAPVGFVTGAGHVTSHEQRDLSRLFPRPDGQLPEVGLLHTQVHASFGSDAHHPYAPSELAFLLRAGYDYWALGHVHERQELASDPPIWYSGSLQGRTHAEQGARGALVVDIADRDAPSVSFRSLAPIRWETIEVDRLDDIQTLDALERRCESTWQHTRAADAGATGTEWMVRVSLRGPCRLWTELRIEEDRQLLARELRETLGVLDVAVVADAVHPLLSLEEHRSRMDILGEALRLAEAVRSSRTVIRGLTGASLAGAPTESQESVDAYVRGLLQEVDGELAARLLEGGADST